MRWLGWLLIAAVLLGGAGLIWYGIANPTDNVAVEAEFTDIDPYLNPEVKLRTMRGTLNSLDPHENPEIARALSMHDAALERVP